MIEVANELGPLGYGIRDRLAQRARRRDARTDFIEPLFERRRDRHGFLLTDL